ncbi:peptidylprolyl isomerase [Paenibacillus sp. FSL R7-0273]|uniref:peptidylprolyl isomerase n=1 Tax=Paenibacillus sp. FSL R7-0273 TaxID=1536772 RepID=UPI0004F7732E|nr:peptidylprolyl isomerase [Paenibacillus sp. FSL R7-0273]AIQ44516.1 peptidylprolyl isomerase [Paenibacillus sp. FSL R7-0273]OMF85452.1 peptidylprolyl isomerase [Paenibacillus sp. FSL R7-0273]
MSVNKAKSWKVLLVSLAAAVSFTMLSACSSNNNAANTAEDTSQAVATYKDGTITEKEFDLDTRVMKFLSPQQAAYLEIDAFKESILKQEVAFEYLAGQASEDAKKQAEKEADEQVGSLKEALGDTYESTLKEQNLTEAEIRSYMVRVLTVYQDMLLKITDEDLKAEFEATKGDYTVATLRHVLVGLTDADGKERTDEDALKRANEVKAKLDAGGDFAAVAKEYSDDTGSVEAGGEYKDKALGSYVEEFKQAAQTLPLNTISEPVKTSFGYHIMEVESRTETAFDSLSDEQKETVKSTLASKNLEKFLDEELDSLEIEINLPKSTAAADESGAAATAAPSATPAATEAAQ